MATRPPTPHLPRTPNRPSQQQPWATPDAPRRVTVLDWETYRVLVVGDGWEGPHHDQVRDLARRVGWQPAVSAALEVDWRTVTTCPPTYPQALARIIGLCYAGRCLNPGSHGGDCGSDAIHHHAERRMDDDHWRIRVRTAGAVPLHPAEQHRVVQDHPRPPEPATPPPAVSDPIGQLTPHIDDPETEATPAPTPNQQTPPPTPPKPAPPPAPIAPPPPGRWRDLHDDAPDILHDLIGRLAARFDDTEAGSRRRASTTCSHPRPAKSSGTEVRG